MSDARQHTIDLALARGVIHEALALALHRPTAAIVERLVSGAGQQVLQTAAAVLDKAEPGAEPLAPVVGRWLRLLIEQAGELATRHHQLFGHTARGDVCPCGTEYGSDGAFHQPHQLADIAGYYRAFGLSVKPGADERVDHAACQCEFVAVLCQKEAVQLEALASDEDLHTTREAVRRFLGDHLGWFGRAFARRLVAADPEGPYGAAGVLLERWLERECDRVGVRSGPAILPLRVIEPDPTPMACGTGDELIQICRRDEISPCAPR